jgi:hypothetical protein
MLIKSRMGVSADGFVSTPEGVPAIAVAPCYSAATVPSQAWPAAGCPLCLTRVPFTAPPGGRAA